MLSVFDLIDARALPVTEWSELPPDVGDDSASVDSHFVPPLATVPPPDWHQPRDEPLPASIAPLPRTCHIACVGADVLAYKRALVRLGLRPTTADRGLTPRQVRTFGQRMRGEVRAFQFEHGLQADGVIGPHTYAALWPSIDPYGRWLLARERKTLSQPLSVTDAVLHHALRSVALAAYWHYAEIRPYPVWELPDHIPTTTDCSGHFGLMRKWANAPSPYGSLGYSGYGNSDTILANGTWVPSPRPADAVLYTNPGHVITCVQWPMGVSHGSEEGPFYLDCRYRPITGFRHFPS